MQRFSKGCPPVRVLQAWRQQKTWPLKSCFVGHSSPAHAAAASQPASRRVPRRIRLIERGPKLDQPHLASRSQVHLKSAGIWGGQTLGRRVKGTASSWKPDRLMKTRLAVNDCCHSACVNWAGCLVAGHALELLIGLYSYYSYWGTAGLQLICCYVYIKF